MRKLLIIILAASLLGSCATTGGGRDLNSVIASIVAGVNNACGYAVAVETVVAILNANAALGVTTVINMICNAVRPSNTLTVSRTFRIPTVRVNGRTIRIHGHF